MKINSLSDLKKLIALCRKSGIASIKVDNIELALGSVPLKTKEISRIDYSKDFPESAIPVPQYTPVASNEEESVSSELTEEQLLYYSVGTEAQ